MRPSRFGIRVDSFPLACLRAPDKDDREVGTRFRSVTQENMQRFCLPHPSHKR